MPRGFTLLELVISISIFVFLTTVTVFSFRGVGRANNLRSASDSLVGSLRRAQGMALAGTATNVCSDYETAVPRRCVSDANCGAETCVSIVPIGGYGVSVSALGTRYALFADLDASATYSAVDDVLVEGVMTTLQDNVRINTLGAVMFLPPRATIKFDTALGNGGNGVQYFCLSHPNVSGLFRRVTVVGAAGAIQQDGVTSCS